MLRTQSGLRAHVHDVMANTTNVFQRDLLFLLTRLKETKVRIGKRDVAASKAAPRMQRNGYDVHESSGEEESCGYSGVHPRGPRSGDDVPRHAHHARVELPIPIGMQLLDDDGSDVAEKSLRPYLATGSLPAALQPSCYTIAHCVRIVDRTLEISKTAANDIVELYLMCCLRATALPGIWARQIDAVVPPNLQRREAPHLASAAAAAAAAAVARDARLPTAVPINASNSVNSINDDANLSSMAQRIRDPSLPDTSNKSQSCTAGAANAATADSFADSAIANKMFLTWDLVHLGLAAWSAAQITVVPPPETLSSGVPSPQIVLNHSGSGSIFPLSVALGGGGGPIQPVVEKEIAPPDPETEAAFAAVLGGRRASGAHTSANSLNRLDHGANLFDRATWATFTRLATVAACGQYHSTGQLIDDSGVELLLRTVHGSRMLPISYAAQEKRVIQTSSAARAAAQESHKRKRNIDLHEAANI